MSTAPPLSRTDRLHFEILTKDTHHAADPLPLVRPAGRIRIQLRRRRLVQRAARHGELPVPRHVALRRSHAGRPRPRRDFKGGHAMTRLATGGRVDRSRVLNFTFNGRSFQGHPGDTLASALLANGVSLVARSWKYHRPRGILSCGVEEPNALVQLFDGARAVPNARMTEVSLVEGLVATSIHASPSVEFDLKAVNGWFSRLIPAGFYYKTFMA